MFARSDRTTLLVPPVGLEPTLPTLLGGSPLPLGYGGAKIVPHGAPIFRAFRVNRSPCHYIGADQHLSLARFAQSQVHRQVHPQVQPLANSALLLREVHE